MSFRSLFSLCIIPLSVGSLSTRIAYAGFMTGFEPPTYTTGPVAGQDGWSIFVGTPSASAFANVENFMAFQGTQAVFISGSAPGQTGPYHTDTVAGPIVDLSAEIFLSASSVETGWQFAATGPGLFPFYAGIDIVAGASGATTNEVTAITGSNPDVGTIARNQWNLVSLVMNFSTDTYDIFINGVQLGAPNLPFCGSNSGVCPGTGTSVTSYSTGFFDTFGDASGDGNDSGFLDNYAVTTVTATPEPVSVLLLGSAGALVLIAKRRNSRKRHAGPEDEFKAG